MSPRVISLFSGAGGLDYGLEAAGFETAATLEFDRDCCATLRASRPSWEVIEESVFDVPTPELLRRAKLKKGDVDLLVGGPPCQPFSKAGYWSRGDSLRLDDPRAHTLSAYMRIVEEAQPRAFMLENVEGLAFAGKDEGLRLLMSQIDLINKRTKSQYEPVFAVLNAADYGVPQLRERVIMIAAHNGTRFQFPPARYRAIPDGSEPSNQQVLPLLPTHRTAWDALAKIVPEKGEQLAIRGKWADLLPSIPEGSNYLHHTERGEGMRLFGWRRRFWSFLLKLAKNRPSWTIQAQPGPAVGPFHWDNRRLSVRELCALQTFPSDVVITGGRTSQQRQLGNAVPSLLAEVLGREIRRQLFNQRPKGDLQLLPPDRSPAPSPTPLKPVPRKFHPLVGDHDAHPGTGLGYGALARTGEAQPS
ncbi:MAG: (cytosine-5)-methyltransferase 1 [Actinomycetota bacterium]|jgi:DNA (cytosine-5)-methyltransferase 1